MSNYTPGPWIATTDGWISASMPNLDRLRVTRVQRISTADAHGGFTSDEVTPANALLIAAAPDMLPALKEAELLLGAHWPTDSAPIARIRAAIAKAEGK